MTNTQPGQQDTLLCATCNATFARQPSSIILQYNHAYCPTCFTQRIRSYVAFPTMPIYCRFPIPYYLWRHEDIPPEDIDELFYGGGRTGPSRCHDNACREYIYSSTTPGRDGTCPKCGKATCVCCFEPSHERWCRE